MTESFMMTTNPYSKSEFLLLSLPGNVGTSHTYDSNVDSWLVKNLIGGRAFVSEFSIPEFKIGSLDSLVLQSEELAKLDGQVSGCISKIKEILGTLPETQKNVYETIPIKNVPVTEYLMNFQWHVRKFKLDKSIRELINEISNETFQLDADVRTTFANYNAAKSNLAAMERKRTGDLSVRSLHDIVSADDFINDSEYLTTLLISVPKDMKDQFEMSYETLAKNVVPESARILTQDNDYILYNVHLFKKSVNSFLNTCRGLKYIPREFNYSEELIDQFKQDLESAANLEQSLRVQFVLLAKTAFSDVFVNWFHIKALRIFVESVLRYGLPPHFITKIIAVSSKDLRQCKSELIKRFDYLGGNAFSKDKYGKIRHNDSSLHEYASLVDTEYEPFVLYSIHL